MIRIKGRRTSNSTKPLNRVILKQPMRYLEDLLKGIWLDIGDKIRAHKRVVIDLNGLSRHIIS